MQKLRKLRRLGWSEQQILLQAMLMLLLIAVLLRLLGLRRCQSFIAGLLLRRPVVTAAPASATFASALRLSRLVNLAAQQGIYAANCLQRSVVLWWLLGRQGVESQIYLGTRKQAGRFEAHAWVELAGVVLNDTADVRQRYVPFSRAISLAKAESQ